MKKVAFAVFGYHAPAVVVAVEVQANYAAVVLGFDCVSILRHYNLPDKIGRAVNDSHLPFKKSPF